VRRFATWATGLVAVASLLAGCMPPSDGAPTSAGVPVLGQSRLSADQLVTYYRAHDPAILPYRVAGTSLEQLAAMFVSEGNRYNVRGDLAFAQSIIETGWFYYPDNGIVRPTDNNFAGIGACNSCGDGYGFSSALNGVRAQIQLLRAYADPTAKAATLPDPPVPELWGSNPSNAASNFDHYFAKGRAPLWNDMGNGNWASDPNYATTVVKLYNDMLWQSQVYGQCPADGLEFGAAPGTNWCPADLRQPGRAMAATPDGLGYYVLNGDGAVTAYNAPAFGSPPNLGGDFARDLAVMPDGQGYVIVAANGTVYKFGSAADPAKLGNVPGPEYGTDDVARSIAITPDGKGFVVLRRDGAVEKFGSAAAGPLSTLLSPWSPGTDFARSVAIMPDGAGYVVLGGDGRVWKYGSATTGLVGSGVTPTFDGDQARDIFFANFFGSAIGYFVLDGSGHVAATAALAPVTNPKSNSTADRWRGLAQGYQGNPRVLKDDGTVAQTTAA
jgi:hypothetical protein